MRTSDDRPQELTRRHHLRRARAHPGAHLREDFLRDFGLTPGALAKAIGLKDRTRIKRLVREEQALTRRPVGRNPGSGRGDPTRGP